MAPTTDRRGVQNNKIKTEYILYYTGGNCIKKKKNFARRANGKNVN